MKSHEMESQMRHHFMAFLTCPAGVRVQKVQKVQKVQRVVVGALQKKGAPV